MTDYLIVDLRPEFSGKPYITFWRSDDAGYAYPLPWAGRYQEAQIVKHGRYYTYSKGRRWVRFAVPVDIAERLGGKPAPGQVDGNVGPVVVNSARNRAALVRARFLPPAIPDDVARLVVASRIVAHGDQSAEALAELDKAVEAFAGRVPWDDEPDAEGNAP